MDGYTVVVTKSTVPVGTAHEVERIIREANPSAEFDVCSNREFLREGAAINDFMRPDRVVIGTNSERAADVMRRLYRPLCVVSETPMLDVSGKRIAVLGVSFKPNTDDVRAAPSLVIIPILQKAGATVAAYDPAAMEEAAHHLSDVEWCKGEYEAIEGADALVVITEWNEFRGLSLKRIAESMKSKTVIDLRNIYKPDLMAERGFHYVSIGRPVVGGADSAALKAVS